MSSDLNQPNPEHIILLAQELSIPVAQIAATAQLLMEVATVPFIARYRKEVTGSLDEVAVTAIASKPCARWMTAAVLFSRVSTNGAC